MLYEKIDQANKTKLVVNQKLLKNVKTLEELKMFIMSANMEIFEDKEIFNKQKIIALKNLTKNLKEIFKENKTFDYSLNLVLRNLNVYHSIQKKEQKIDNKVTNFIPTKETKIIINSLIFLAFSNSFSKIIKAIYIK
ncbi:hypothetical protein [Aliarcobacter butzleri]|uniref:hypothetical protein n=1 Tax=Aliarcobacter butzleri TaxID=28197 RepID=UPI00263C931A|nr:hypothetical protein [Aliarcobacter butzleri]MDN5082009.1 hypothetical protein [Aliarcobacter butzleri]MDN5084319.1 hypothetical protein [Aliarcobacter butzleri]